MRWLLIAALLGGCKPGRCHEAASMTDIECFPGQEVEIHGSYVICRCPKEGEGSSSEEFE